jgi:methylenetetrahydrofolate dehydrogenase (NADP+)/methenyltetrahydrofolate cyclohydrolase
MILLDGKKTSEEYKKIISAEVADMKLHGMQVPHLAVILIGNSGASETYVSNKIKTCKELGFNATLIRSETSITEKELLTKIENINNDNDIDGLIVQSPLPNHISHFKISEAIHPSKDVDGFHPMNAGRLQQNQPCFVAATPKGIMLLLEKYKIETAGKHCVVVGRSNIVGMPMSILLSKNSYPGNCTVTICHSKTKNISSFTKDADILVAALGKAEFITAEMVKENVVVIDVGITRVESTESKSGYKLKGDVKFDEVAPKCSYITPVPGGVGPMTIIGLLQNTLLAAKKEIYK